MTRTLTIALALAALGLAAAPRVVAAAGRWAALGDARQCDAASLALLPASKLRGQGRASLSFDAAGRGGQFTATLSKPSGSGTAMLTIDEQPFMLVARGAHAWSRGAGQEAAIVAAMRSGTRMRIEGRSLTGARFIDRYELAGAPTAIDAAAACASAL